MPIAYHHHMGTLIETRQELDLLVESTSPAVALILGSGHLAFAGGDLTLRCAATASVSAMSTARTSPYLDGYNQWHITL